MFGSLLSPSSFIAPDWLPPSGWLEHGPFASWLVNAHRPATLVELGTHHGYSYAIFCAAVEASGLDTRCFAVDTWRGDEHAGFYDDSIFRAFAAHHDPRFGTFSQLMRMTFDEALPRFADQSIDLLHLDGRHFYEDARHDFVSWLPKLSDRAVVLLHDTQERGRDFGVFRLWAELAGAHPHFEFVHGHGLGVLGVGRQQPEALSELFAATATPQQTSVRQAYEFLGKAIADRRAHIVMARKLRHAVKERDDALELAQQQRGVPNRKPAMPWPVR